MCFTKLIHKGRHAPSNITTDGWALQEALVGGVGQEFVQSELSRPGQTPQQALLEIRRKAGLRNPHCLPLLGLLDQLGKRR